MVATAAEAGASRNERDVKKTLAFCQGADTKSYDSDQSI
jgi:hypothetical protein